MAIHTFDVAPISSSDATFRAWIQAVHTALATFFTYVAQTGEIDLTAALVPSAANQYRGFRMYRMNDTHQAAAPFFMKVEFGSSTSAAAQPALRITFGNGIDGSGNFLVGTGLGSTTPKVISLQSSSASVFRSYFSGDSGSLRATFWPQFAPPNTSVPLINLERQRDSNGNTVSDGVLILLGGGATFNAMQGIFTKEGVFIDCADGQSVASSLRASPSTALFGLKLGIFPVNYMKGPLIPPPLGVLMYYSGDLPVTSWPLIVSETVYGAAHNYLVGGPAYYQSRGATNANHSFLLRYE